MGLFRPSGFRVLGLIGFRVFSRLRPSVLKAVSSELPFPLPSLSQAAQRLVHTSSPPETLSLLNEIRV